MRGGRVVGLLVSLLVLGWVAAPMSAATTRVAATVTLKPSVGPPTTKVTVTGSGFGAIETVTVRFDTTQVATAVTDGGGSFSTTFVVPKAALPGSHSVRATGQTSGLSATRKFLVRTNWPKFHFDVTNSGYNPYENVIGPTNVSGLKIAWTGATTFQIYGSSPAVANGVAYVGSDDGKLYAFSAAGTTNCSGTPKTCTPLWTGGLGGAENVQSSPTVANGVVYISRSGGPVSAFSTAAGTTNCSGTPKTCTPLWTASVFGTVTSSPAVAHGVLYVSAYFDLYAFSAAGTTNCSGTPKTCTPLWTAPGGAGGYIASSPAIANGVVYLGTGGGLEAFSAAGTTNCSGTPKTCTPLWTTATGGSPSSTPAVANGVVYIGSPNDNLYAFSAAGTTNCSGTPKTCTPLWTGATAGATDESSPAVANGVVYVGTTYPDNKLYGFSAAGTTNCSGTPKTCTPLWTGATAGGIDYSSPAVANGVVYVGSDDGKLYAFSR